MRVESRAAPVGLAAAVLLLAALLPATACRRAQAEEPPSAIVVNECATGPNGWIELLNRGSAPVDVSNDPALCYYVDDQVGGGSPRLIGEGSVNHAAPAACAAAGRSAACGVIGPGEAVWVKYPFVNGTSPDACRLLTVPKVGVGAGMAGVCAGTLRDASVGGLTASTAPGQCFGRQPDGAAWSSAPIACTPGGSNGKCTAGAPCDDGNACTRGETFSPTCECTGGTPLNGAPCGSGRICQVGTCTPTPSGAPAMILGQGSRGLLLTGTLVTPDEVVDGEVLILGDEIRCAGPSCAGDPAVATASVVQTNGIIFPGLIDAHDRIQMSVFDESDFAPEAGDHFLNHTQWADAKRYRALMEAEQNLTGQAKGARASIGCELAKFGKLKQLIAGVTSVVGSPSPEDRKCYGTLGRTLDQRGGGLPGNKVQAAPPPRTGAEVDKICAAEESGKLDAFLISIGNGVDDISRNEFQRLFDMGGVKGCLFSPKTAVLYGASLQDRELGVMGARGMSLVWTPRSNVFFYGHGTDLTKTADIPAALERGVTVAIATDSSVGGSQNLLDELRFAHHVDATQWGDVLPARALVQMVTKNPARMLGVRTALGELSPGHKADLVVVGGDRARAYDAILAASPRDVRLVVVGGKILYGDTALKVLADATPECDPLDICGVRKFACIAQAGGAPADLLGQHYEDIRGKILVEMQKLDERKLSEWKFTPPAELCKCGL
jgi:hypothetical protein